jgi:UDP-N-acetylglucosamine 3-dehydrogenase
MSGELRVPSLRIGVVGCGGIGQTHLQAYRALGVTPAALAEPNPAALAAAQAEYGGQPFADYREMLATTALDAISVCTPPATHAEIAEAALAAGMAVLCEKPLAPTVEACESMVAAAARAERLLSVGFCHRFQPHIEQLDRLISAGTLGAIVMFRNRFAGHLRGVEETWFAQPEIAGGGVMFDTCVHSVDLFRYLVGEPVEVQAIASTTATELGPALEVEDSAIISLRTASGALGVIEASWRTPPGEWTVSVYGTAGVATMDYGTNQLRVRLESDEGWHAVEVPEGNRFEREIQHFLSCIQGLAAPRVTAADGLAATRILTAAYASAQFASQL